MKLPSINYLLRESTDTLRRFPFPIASAAIATFLYLVLIGDGRGIERNSSKDLFEFNSDLLLSRWTDCYMG